MPSSNRDRGEAVGDLAIVLHSHMPYVEGFGTYPFGEEWLFDAVARSYLPLLDRVRDLTITVTPVLADQLEAPGVAERMEAFLRRYRLEAAERDAAQSSPELRPAAEAEAERYRRSLARLEDFEGDVLAAFRLAGERNVALVPSCGHSRGPAAGRHHRRPAPSDRRRAALARAPLRAPPRASGFPSAPTARGSSRCSAERGLRFFCTDQSASERPLDALAPVRAGAGLVAFTLDWEAVELVWSQGGYPSDPGLRRVPPGLDGGNAPVGDRRGSRTTRRRRALGPSATPSRSPTPWPSGLRHFRERRDAPGLVTFAIDTELLGHWWSEGPDWLAAVLRLVPERGIRLVTLPQALERHVAEERPLRESTWGEGKDLRTWDSPEVADLAWAARRLELRLLRAAVTNELAPAAAERAARELLALQASDWAFLDRRKQAGDYPYQRSTAHARALLEAIHSRQPPDPRMRNLAPDLSLVPLLEP